MAPSDLPLPSRRRSTNDGAALGDLSQSLRQLSLATSSAANSPRSPKPLIPSRAAVSRTSPSPNPRVATAPRSPSLGRESRSATPTLLRKASTSSLRSVSGVGPSQPSSRRSSSAQMMSPLSFNPPEPEEKPPVTANSVAKDHFQAELESHHGVNSSQSTEAIVFINDACYGHRYSRPRTSRANLSTIVERPERIKASAVGVAMAYVRIGERHAEGTYPIHPKHSPASIPTLPFRIRKTNRRVPLSSATVTNVHGTKWMEELKIMCDSAESKLAMGAKELQRPEMNRGPDAPLPRQLHDGDLYLCAESLDAMEGALGAVCDAVDSVFAADTISGPRRAFVAVRPPGHHCSASYPSGFCWINNVHVGIMHAIMNHGLTHAAIIDFDLHHGDGSQSIAWDHNTRGRAATKSAAAWKKTSIGYFSLHDINSYPCEEGDIEKVKNASVCIDNAHGQSIWNVHLEPWKSEAQFWQLYESRYSILLDKTREFLNSHTERLQSANQTPKAAIFLSAGFDASEWESSGMQRHSVNVPTEFYARFTQDVVRIAAEAGTSAGGRVVSVLEGGYSDRALRSGILSHLSGLVGDQTILANKPAGNGLGIEMGQRLGAVDDSSSAPTRPSWASTHVYNPAWWSSSELDSLEATIDSPPIEPKKPRHVEPPTYSSPTQASSAKVNSTARLRRSLSGLSTLNGSAPRPPSPPPPEVHWTVAAAELSKLLIPLDRQTGSCTHEDLNAEATRVRRDRQSMIQPRPEAPAPPDRSSSRMALRDRKPAKVVESIEEADEQLSKITARSLPDAASAMPKATARGMATEMNGNVAARRQSRRLSGAPLIVAASPDIPSRSTSVRPDSSMSVRTQASTPLTTRKARTVNTAKKPEPKSARAIRKPAINPNDKPTNQASSSSKIQRKTGDTDDELSAGMSKMELNSSKKKPKINLITKAQKEAREREELKRKPVTPPADDTLPSLPESTIFSAPPLLATASIDSEGSAGDISPTQSVVRDGPMLATPTPIRGTDALVVPLISSSPALPTPTDAVSLSTPDIFVHYQAEGPEPVAMPRQEPLKWLPPNADTPSPSPLKQTPPASTPMKRTDLPVFTSTSTISFAPLQTSANLQNGSGLPSTKEEAKQETKHEKVEPSLWDLPETPQK